MRESEAVSWPPDGSRAAVMARHVRVGAGGYQSLDGASLELIEAWNGRVQSVEVIVTDLAASLRSSGFRPFRPLLCGPLRL